MQDIIVFSRVHIMLNCFKRIIPVGIILTCIGVGAYAMHKDNIKTHLRLREKIVADIPNNYVPKKLESDLANLLKNGRIQGVHVLYEPMGSGKTTAIKKVLKDIQDDNAKDILNLHNGDNKIVPTTVHLKPLYIDAKTESFEWQKQFGNSDARQNGFIQTIPENTKVIVVIDHMTKEIIDGFDESWIDHNGKCREARIFFSHYATLSYNTGYKFVIVVVTDDREYAKNILKCNGCHKVHQIVTDNDPDSKLYLEALKESTDSLQCYLDNIKSLKK